MQRYVAFLRSINVGGRRVKGPELVSIFTELGLSNAANFLASGNVVFDAPSKKGLATRIEEGLEEALGYDVPTLLRTAAEVRAIATKDAFPPDVVAASAGKVQVSLLSKKPSAKAKATVLAMATEADRLTVIGRELYWLPSGGMSESDLDTLQIERVLGMQTRRTSNTMVRLVKKFLS